MMLYRHPGYYKASSYDAEWSERWPKEKGDAFLRERLGNELASKIIADDFVGFVYTGVQEPMSKEQRR